MIITTLGTSHGDPTTTRFNSSVLVEAGATRYLIDAGEPVTALLLRKDVSPSDLRAVFINHMHGDHVGGLPNLIKYLQKHPPKRTVDLFLPEKEAIPALGVWLQAMHRAWPTPVVALHTVHPGPIYQHRDLVVTAIPTRHVTAADGGPASYAFLLQTDGKQVVYTGDLSPSLIDLPDIIRSEPTDLCLLEAQHYAISDALPLLSSCPIRKLVLTHVADRWHGTREQDLLDIVAQLPYPVAVAHDGDQFIV